MKKYIDKLNSLIKNDYNPSYDLSFFHITDDKRYIIPNKIEYILNDISSIVKKTLKKYNASITHIGINHQLKTYVVLIQDKPAMKKWFNKLKFKK